MDYKKFVKEIASEARLNLEKDGSLCPVAFFETPKGLGIFPLNNIPDKELVALLIRRIAVESEARMVLFISEAWMKTYGENETPDCSTPISQQKDRVECVFFQLETMDGSWFGAVPMKEKNGVKTFDENFELTRNDTNKGRMANLLPDKKVR